MYAIRSYYEARCSSRSRRSRPTTVRTTDPGFQAWMGGIQARMEAVLARLLPAATLAPERLHAAMRYATLEGGKRVRPLLCFASGELTGAAPARLRNTFV